MSQHRLPPRTLKNSPPVHKKAGKKPFRLPGGPWLVIAAVFAIVALAGYGLYRVGRTAYDQAQQAAARDASAGGPIRVEDGKVYRHQPATLGPEKGRLVWTQDKSLTKVFDDGWVQVASGQFRIEMPAIPAQSFSKLVDEKCHSDVYRSWSAQNVDQKIAASASFCDLSFNNWEEDIATIIGRTRDRFVREAGGEPIAERPVAVDGVDGLEVDLRRGEKRSIVRLFEKHGVFFVFEISGVGLESESPAVTRYWESLELMPENLDMRFAREKKEQQNEPASGAAAAANPNETDAERVQREAQERHAAAVAEAERRHQEGLEQARKNREEVEKKMSSDPQWRATQERIRQTKERLAEEARLREEERARERERRQAEFEQRTRPSTNLPIPLPPSSVPPK
ncbi:MAG: hypothetical protein WBC44_00055 [Planctomycetaceae bacterium]